MILRFKLIRRVNVCVCAVAVVSDSAILWTIAGQAPLSMGFFQEFWDGLPFTEDRWIDINNTSGSC